jgi:hypothetical protein
MFLNMFLARRIIILTSRVFLFSVLSAAVLWSVINDLVPLWNDPHRFQAYWFSNLSFSVLMTILALLVCVYVVGRQKIFGTKYLRVVLGGGVILSLLGIPLYLLFAWIFGWPAREVLAFLFWFMYLYFLWWSTKTSDWLSELNKELSVPPENSVRGEKAGEGSRKNK